MKEKIKNIGWGILGFGILAGILLLISLFIKGGVWLSAFIYPIIYFVSGITFLVLVLILFPLLFFKKTRNYSALGVLISSYVIGLSLWVWSFLLTYLYWGGVGVFVGLILAGVGLVPTAILASLFNGDWFVLAQLVFLLFVVFSSRFLAIRIGEDEEWVKKHKTPIAFSFLGVIIVLMIFSWYVKSITTMEDEQMGSSGGDETCLQRKITFEELESIAAEKNIEATEGDLDWINSQPLCEDLCKEQLGYAEKYSDWSASEELRTTCKDLGIVLPE